MRVCSLVICHCSTCSDCEASERASARASNPVEIGRTAAQSCRGKAAGARLPGQGCRGKAAGARLPGQGCRGKAAGARLHAMVQYAESMVKLDNNAVF
jgi:hypothetical protein